MAASNYVAVGSLTRFIAGRAGKALIAYGDRALFVSVSILVLLEVFLVRYTGIMSELTHQNLFSEDTNFTYISAIQIGMIAVLSLVTWALNGVTRGGRGSYSHRAAWLMCSGFFTILALDELLGLHERVAQLTGRVFTWSGVTIASSYWDAPFFALYALTGLALWAAVRGETRKFSAAWWYLSTSSILLATAVYLDLFKAGILLVMWEDAFKLLGFLFLLAAVSSCALQSIRENQNGRT